MDEKFIIDQNIPIILYGASSIGILTYNIFINQGVNIVGFIDKRAYEIPERCSLPVWSIDGVPQQWDKSSVVIVVTVKNVFDHDNILSKLIENGFENILYKPSSVIAGYADENDSLIDMGYEQISKGIIPRFNIPKTKKISIYNFKDYALLRSENDIQTIYIPTTLVNTDLYNDGAELFEDIPIYALYPHVGLFSYLSGDEAATYHDYIKFCSNAAQNVGQIELTQAWKDYTLKNRAMIYEQMVKSMELDYDFFIRNAPEASYNKHGYFNLHSGKHRAAFFAAKARQYMPLRISNVDYSKYLNTPVLTKFIKYVESNNIYFLEEPILHPYFYQFPCHNREFFRIYAQKIMEWLSRNKSTKEITIWDDNDDNGYISRLLAMNHCYVTRKIVSTMCKLVDDLFYLDSTAISQTPNKDTDMIFYNCINSSSSDIGIISSYISISDIIAIVPQGSIQGKVLFSGCLNYTPVDVIHISKM